MINLPKKLSLALILSFALLVWGTTGARAATFSLSPASGSTVSGTFTVTLGLTDLAGKQVSSVDVYLNYEPSKLGAVSVSHSGGIFTSYPLETIDSTTGKIAIGANASSFTPVTSSGTIATITFKALASSGSTTLRFDYTPATPPVTTDSNIVEHGTSTELLTQPPTVIYNFGGTTTPSVPTPTPTPTTPSTPKGAPSASPSGTPAGGILEPTLLISLLSFLLIGLGFFFRVL
jgi:hypothetical protein